MEKKKTIWTCKVIGEASVVRMFHASLQADSKKTEKTYIAFNCQKTLGLTIHIKNPDVTEAVDFILILYTSFQKFIDIPNLKHLLTLMTFVLFLPLTTEDQCLCIKQELEKELQMGIVGEMYNVNPRTPYDHNQNQLVLKNIMTTFLSNLDHKEK